MSNYPITTAKYWSAEGTGYFCDCPVAFIALILAGPQSYELMPCEVPVSWQCDDCEYAIRIRGVRE